MALKFSIDFVTNFLKENGDEIIQEKWVDEQPKFKKLFKKNESKSTAEKGPKKNKSAYNIYCSENPLKAPFVLVFTNSFNPVTAPTKSTNTQLTA